MTDKTKHLPTDPEALQAMVLSLQSQVENLTAEKLHLIEQFRLAQQQRFGASSEGHPAQGDLFNEAETELDVTEETPESAPIITKKKPIRKNYRATYLVKLSFMTLKIKSVDAVVMNYITWMMSAVKSLSLFQPK
jgi:hypothetical protein